MYVAGGSSKAKAESSQELQRRQERERQVDGFRVDSDSEALPKSAFHNLVSELRYTDGRKVLGTQDKEDSSIAAVSKWDTEILQKSGTACIPRRAVWFQRRVLYDRLVQQSIIKWRISVQNGERKDKDASVQAAASPVEMHAKCMRILKSGQRI